MRHGDGRGRFPPAWPGPGASITKWTNRPANAGATELSPDTCGGFISATPVRLAPVEGDAARTPCRSRRSLLRANRDASGSRGIRGFSSDFPPVTRICGINMSARDRWDKWEMKTKRHFARFHSHLNAQKAAWVRGVRARWNKCITHGYLYPCADVQLPYSPHSLAPTAISRPIHQTENWHCATRR